MPLRTQRTVLPNGLRLMLTPLGQTQAVTVLLLTKVGSRYETPATNGVSHFLEHMMFKGTTTRPTARDVAIELDRVGADYNAFTSKDSTGYYVKLSADHLDLAVDIIADMLWHSTFAAEEIAKERKVIIEEINMYHDNPAMLLEDVFEETMFGASHPLGWHIAGKKPLIATMSRATVVNHFRRHYSPRNMVLSIAGKFQPARASTLARRHFGLHVPSKVNTFRRFHTTQTAPKCTVQFRDTEQVQLALGFPALSYDHPDQATLSVLSVILGGNMSSRLFTRVREQEGLCYHIAASRSPYQDTGTFCIRSGLDIKRIEPALRLILSVLREFLEKGVTKEELENGKEFLRGKLTLALEDSEEIADYFAKQELLMKHVRTPEQRFAAIRRVTTRDIVRVARNLFRISRTNCALIGPFRNPAPFLRILRRW